MEKATPVFCLFVEKTYTKTEGLKGEGYRRLSPVDLFCYHSWRRNQGLLSLPLSRSNGFSGSRKKTLHPSPPPNVPLLSCYFRLSGSYTSCKIYKDSGEEFPRGLVKCIEWTPHLSFIKRGYLPTPTAPCLSPSRIRCHLWQRWYYTVRMGDGGSVVPGYSIKEVEEGNHGSWTTLFKVGDGRLRGVYYYK